MVAEREHAILLANVTSVHAGSFYSAAISDSQLFGYYFVEHIRDAADAIGADVYPYAYGAQGAFLIMAAGYYGWWHDSEEGVTYQSVGTDTNNAIVFGLDLDRLNLIRDKAIADGLTVVRCIRMDTNEVCS